MKDTHTGFDLSRALFGASSLLLDRSKMRGWLERAKAQAAILASPEAVQAAMVAFAQRQVEPRMVGDVAVIECCGPITYKSSWLSMYFGGTSIEDMQQKLRTALNDSAVKTIAFRWDSPGGCVDMVPEFADEVFAAASGPKLIISMADTDICSAAYWIASQSKAIYASASSILGSIGVWTEHDDISGMLEKAGVVITLISHGDHKVDGNPYEPLPDDVRASIQADVDEIGAEFEVAVARGRGVTTKVVLDTFGQGKAFRGKQAIKLGLADKPGTFTQVLDKLTKGRGVSACGSVAAALAATDPALDAGRQPLAEQAALREEIAIGAKKAKTSVCETCGKSSCPCEEEECPIDCPTCDPECPCRQQDDDVDGNAAAVVTPETKAEAAAASDEEGLIAAQ